MTRGGPPTCGMGEGIKTPVKKSLL